MQDLWPDSFEKPKTKSPVKILLEQADFLEKKTNSVVAAEVAVNPMPFFSESINDAFKIGLTMPFSLLFNYEENMEKINNVISTGEQASLFYYDFNLVVSALGDYRTRLFSIAHKAEFYPVTFYLPSELAEELNVIKEISADNEEDFLEFVKILLRTKTVRKTVQTLLAQV